MTGGRAELSESSQLLKLSPPSEPGQARFRQGHGSALDAGACRVSVS